MADRLAVPAGAIEVAAGETVLIAVGLGSCVAVAIDDPVRRVGGLAHIVLPGTAPVRGVARRSRYAASAVPLLVERIEARGGRRERLRARLVGGAAMFPELQTPGLVSLGERNIAVTRALLTELGVPVTGEDTGGNHGRSVSFFPGTGRLVVRTAWAGEIEL